MKQNLDLHHDLFIQTVSDISAQDQRDLMERPFFSLSKSKRVKPIVYTSPNNDINLRVDAMPKHGMATIWDADILIWAASQIKDAQEKGLHHSNHFRTNSAYEILKFIRRGTGGDHYKRLKQALYRLQSTTISTNIRPKLTKKNNKIKKKENVFSWIYKWSVTEDKDGNCLGLEFIIDDWLYKGIVDNKLVLAINPDYFDLKGGIERWLYRVVRKHGGTQSTGWAFTFRTLHEKSGSIARFSNFAIQIRKIVKAQSIPDYWLDIQRNKQDEEVLYFLHRSKLDHGHEGFRLTHPYHSKFTPK